MDTGVHTLEAVRHVGSRFRAADTYGSLRRGRAYVVVDVQVAYADPSRRTGDDHFEYTLRDEGSGATVKLTGLREELMWFARSRYVIPLPTAVDAAQAVARAAAATPKPISMKERCVAYVKANPGQPMHVIHAAVAPEVPLANVGAALSHLVKKRVLWSEKRPSVSEDGKLASVYFSPETHKPPRRSSRFEDSF